jgi:membrane protein DedA with SNARE-associated domain
MFAIAAVSSAAPYGAWAYVAVFALMTLAFAGIPGIGTAVVGWAAVLASQGKLDIVAVLVVAAMGAEVGGLAGYSIGDRWAASSWIARAGGRRSGGKLSPRGRQSTQNGDVSPSSSRRPWSPALSK